MAGYGRVAGHRQRHCDRSEVNQFFGGAGVGPGGHRAEAWRAAVARQRAAWVRRYREWWGKVQAVERPAVRCLDCRHCGVGPESRAWRPCGAGHGYHWGAAPHHCGDHCAGPVAPVPVRATC